MWSGTLLSVKTCESLLLLSGYKETAFKSNCTYFLETNSYFHLVRKFLNLKETPLKLYRWSESQIGRCETEFYRSPVNFISQRNIGKLKWFYFGPILLDVISQSMWLCVWTDSICSTYYRNAHVSNNPESRIVKEVANTALLWGFQLVS